MKKPFVAVALCCMLICSPAHAKTFVGVLWPMFGPLPAIGLAELVAEVKLMPDVDVKTYMHQSWPSLVDDINRQPRGTRTVVIGYSLGANSTVFVANKAKYVDLIVALQPSMLSWNPKVRGKVGRMIEVYNPNPSMTFGGMGSKKLAGGNIEYIANNDSHPGAQFDPAFRGLVKREIAKLSARKAVEFAQAEINKPRTPRTPPSQQLAAEERPNYLPRMRAAFLDSLSSSVDSGNLLASRRLTAMDLIDYARRTYRVSHMADDLGSKAFLTADAAAAGAHDVFADRNLLTDKCACEFATSEFASFSPSAM